MAPTLENTIQNSNQMAKGKQHLMTTNNKPTGTTTTTTNNNNNNNKSLIKPSSSFQQMLDQVDDIFNRSTGSVDIDELWQVLEGHKSNIKEWAKYAYYDQQRYKRNLVADHDKYNVMILCWGPNTKSCIHDHSGSHCFMKVLDGELIESRFAWPDENQIVGAQSQEMCRLSDTRMELNDVLYINDKVGLHLVENPSLNKTAASLHVYIPPYRECKAFDQMTGQAQKCQLHFYSKCGRIIAEDEQEQQQQQQQQQAWQDKC